jgi:hypothetical protein
MTYSCLTFRKETMTFGRTGEANSQEIYVRLGFP